MVQRRRREDREAAMSAVALRPGRQLVAGGGVELEETGEGGWEDHKTLNMLLPGESTVHAVLLVG